MKYPRIKYRGSDETVIRAERILERITAVIAEYDKTSEGACTNFSYMDSFWLTTNVLIFLFYCYLVLKSIDATSYDFGVLSEIFVYLANEPEISHDLTQISGYIFGGITIGLILAYTGWNIWSYCKAFDQNWLQSGNATTELARKCCDILQEELNGLSFPGMCHTLNYLKHHILFY